MVMDRHLITAIADLNLKLMLLLILNN
jgi:hypothetical protein